MRGARVPKPILNLPVVTSELEIWLDDRFVRINEIERVVEQFEIIKIKYKVRLIKLIKSTIYIMQENSIDD